MNGKIYLNYLLSIFFFVFLIQYFGSVKSELDESQPSIVPPKSIVHMTFGYNNIIADSLWIRLIQDLDKCDTAGKKQAKTFVEQLDADFKAKRIDGVQADLSKDKIFLDKWREPRCHLGWGYHMLDRITDLSPNFRSAYLNGGLMLSVVVDDREGAERIYDKALKHFPTDWNLAYHAGYNSLFETRNFEKAAEYFRRAADNGAPGWLYALTAKIYDNIGQAELTVRYLESVLSRNPDAEFRPAIQQRLEEAREILKQGGQ